jgi:rubrerythrin
MAYAGESLVAKYNHCLFDKAGAKTDKEEARRLCMAEVLDDTVKSEAGAQKMYGDLMTLLPSQVKVLTEIRADEKDHETKVRTILMQVTKREIKPESIRTT